MNIKPWKLWLFSSICFLFASIMYVIDKKYLMAITFALLGVSYIFISMSNRQKDNKPNKIEVPDAVLKDVDEELKSLIAEGMKIQAIKKYRMVTGLGLKEAKDYVDSLSEENKN